MSSSATATSIVNNATKVVANVTANATKTANATSTTTTKAAPPEWMAWFTLSVIICMIIGFVFQVRANAGQI